MNFISRSSLSKVADSCPVLGLGGLIIGSLGFWLLLITIRYVWNKIMPVYYMVTHEHADLACIIEIWLGSNSVENLLAQASHPEATVTPRGKMGRP